MSQTKAQLVGGVGISTAENLVVSGIVTATTANIGAATTFTEDLVVNGDARVTGILTVGTSSITLDGDTNEIRVGGGVTLSSSTGLSGSGANLTSLNASELTSGTLPDARFPATLPITSGANLTSLNASNLSSGTVATARLGSGSASSANFLRGDQTWAEAGGGAWEFITSATASGSATLEITSGIDSTYDVYAIIFDNIASSTFASIYVRYSSNGGSTYGTSYRYIGTYAEKSSSSGTAGGGIGSNSTTELQLRQASDSDSVAAGVLYLYGPSVSSIVPTNLQEFSYYNDASWSMGTQNTWAFVPTNTTINAVRFYPNSGTISGTLRLYGIKNS